MILLPAHCMRCPCGRQPCWLVLADDGSDMFAAQRRLQQMWLEPIDNLELLHLAGACEKINERAVKWQGRQVALLEFRHCDFANEGGLRIDLGICLVEAIHVLDQR